MNTAVLAIAFCVFVFILVMTNIERGSGVLQAIALLLIILALPVAATFSEDHTAASQGQNLKYASASMAGTAQVISSGAVTDVKPTARLKQPQTINQTREPTAKPTEKPTAKPTAKPKILRTPCPTAHSGDAGSVVELLQVRLTDLGYILGDIDGVYGSKTVSAVKRFQELNGLDATGEVDASTYKAIFSESAKRYVLYISATKESETKSGPTNEDYREKATKGTKYVLNTSTMKFHKSSCRYVKKIKPTNYKEYNGTREEVIAKGYNRCKVCYP